MWSNKGDLIFSICVGVMGVALVGVVIAGGLLMLNTLKFEETNKVHETNKE